VPDVSSAIGSFHPLILHLPIGLVVGAACLELWSLRHPAAPLRRAIGILLNLASWTALVTVGCGLLLAAAGGYEEDLLGKHRLFGLATAGSIVACAIAHCRLSRANERNLRAAFRLLLVTSVVALAGAGYYGGMITHGSETPFVLLAKALGGRVSHGNGQSVDALGGWQGAGSAAAAGQILESRCFECHGPEKQKSGLRLDKRWAALTGGESGKPAVVPGDAFASALIRAITLPGEDRRAMPPSGKIRLAPAEVVLLIDWINQGAAWPDDLALRANAVSPASAATIAQVRDAGCIVGELARDNRLLRIDWVSPDTPLSVLAPVTQQIAWLDLSGYRLEPGELGVVAAMSNLTRLELQRSNVAGTDLVALAGLAHLKFLNLYGTDVDDSGLEHMRRLSSLRWLYLWQTGVSDSGIAALREALPELLIDRGVNLDRSSDRNPTI
jgi:uncharacterized membrane protein